MNLLTLCNALIPVFFVLGLGFLAGKRHSFSPEQAAGLGKLALNYALPASLLVGMSGLPKALLAPQTRLIVCLLVVHVGLLLIANLVLQRIFHLDTTRSLIFALVLIASATPVFGVAMLSPLLGPTTIGAVGLVSLAMNLAVPVGITLLEIDRAKKASAEGTKAASEASPNPIKTGVLLGLRSPLLWAPVVGAAIALSGVHLPETLKNSLDILGSATAGVAVFAVGISLAAHPLRLSKAVMWGSLSRISLQACCLFLLAELLHVKGPIYRESLICCTLPPAATVNLLAMTYNSAQTETASILSFTTLLLIGTIPLALYVTSHV